MSTQPLVSNPLDVFSDQALPRWARVHQRLDAESVGSIADAVAREFARPEIRDSIRP